jgi:NADPH:quinone reductase-like Zn-dependent oxidoreductase
MIIPLALILWGFTAYWTTTNDCNRDASAPNDPMKAVRYCEYGLPDVVKLDEVEKPVPNDNQVLIKVRASSLNAFDAYVIRDSWLGRLIFGLRKPRDTRLGQDVAGQVEAVGKNVTQFKPGDEVFGISRGSLA